MQRPLWDAAAPHLNVRRDIGAAGLILGRSLHNMAHRLAAIALALGGLYAALWGLIYMTADRSRYLFIRHPDGTLTRYLGTPFPEFFPDPGYDTEGLAAAALVVGVALLVTGLVLVARNARST
jgi:vacuolar-type H+-ATPase subunit I/STV1